MTDLQEGNPEDKLSLDRVADVLKWLGHPDRLAAIKLLNESPDSNLGLMDITSMLSLATPTASRHMSILKKIGLVERINAGQVVKYRLRREDNRVRQILKLINSDHGVSDPLSGLRP